MTDYTIRLPKDNPGRIKYLKSKLVEAAEGVDEFKKGLDSRLPNELKEFFTKANSPDYTRLSILSDLFYDKKVGSYDMFEAVEEETKDYLKKMKSINLNKEKKDHYLGVRFFHFNQQFACVKNLIEQGEELQPLR